MFVAVSPITIITAIDARSDIDTILRREFATTVTGDQATIITHSRIRFRDTTDTITARNMDRTIINTIAVRECISNINFKRTS